MAIRELTLFDKLLGAKLAVAGFRRMRNGGADYWHRGELRSLSFGFHVVDYETKVHLEPSAAIRFEEVERTFHETSGLPQDMQADTCTISAPSESFDCNVHGGGFVVLGLGDHDVNRAVSEAEGIFMTGALPFFDRFRTLDDVNMLLNGEPESPSPFRVAEYERCCRGLIVAKLVQTPNIQDLLATYSDRMKREADGFFLKRFMRLVNSLGLER